MDLPPHIKTELSQWNEGEGISSLDWISVVGSYEYLAGYCQLLWPKFLVYEGRIFISDLLEGREEEFRLCEAAKRSELQKMINALDVTGIFGGAADIISDEYLISIAQTLRETWTAKLNQDFPADSARVIIEDNLAEKGIGDLLVTIGQT